MKKQIMLLLAFVLALNICAFAQQGGGQRMSPEERSKAQVERLTKELSLSKEQASKLDTVFLESNKAMQKMREDARNNGGSFDRAAFEKYNAERDAKVKAVLTEEQYKKYEAQQAEQRQRMQNRGGNGGGRGGN